jgi:hypothetical protein
MCFNFPQQYILTLDRTSFGLVLTVTLNLDAHGYAHAMIGTDRRTGLR